MSEIEDNKQNNALVGYADVSNTKNILTSGAIASSGVSFSAVIASACQASGKTPASSVLCPCSSHHRLLVTKQGLD
jgi:hypothetical protein